MRITNNLTANYANNKQNQPKFGMKIVSMEDGAIEILKNYHPSKCLQEIIPEVENLKAKNGEELFAGIIGGVSKEKKILKFTVTKANGGTYSSQKPLELENISDPPADLNTSKTVFNLIRIELSRLTAKINNELTVQEEANFLTRNYGREASSTGSGFDE